MAVGREIRRIRCEEVLEKFFDSSKTRTIFLTFTTKDVVDIYTIRGRWRNIRHYLCERYPHLKYVMNYELHPKGHGWHIHSVWNGFINLRGSDLKKLQSFGFGRINVERVNTLGVADYLSKHCLKAYRGVGEKMHFKGKRLRLVNTSRGLPSLGDFQWQSTHQDNIKKILADKVFDTDLKTLSWFAKYRLAELSLMFGVSPIRLYDSRIKGIKRYINSSLAYEALKYKSPLHGFKI